MGLLEGFGADPDMDRAATAHHVASCTDRLGQAIGQILTKRKELKLSALGNVYLDPIGIQADHLFEGGCLQRIRLLDSARMVLVHPTLFPLGSEDSPMEDPGI